MSDRHSGFPCGVRQNLKILYAGESRFVRGLEINGGFASLQRETDLDLKVGIGQITDFHF